MAEREYVRLKDITAAMHLPRTTIKDWINDYHMFIPSTKEGRTTLYKIETVDVLREIQKLKDKGLYKPDIFKHLKDEGFPITVEEAAQEMEEALENHPRDNLLQVFQVMGQAVKKLSEQDVEMTEIKNRLNETVEKHELEEIKKRLSETAEKNEIEDLKKQNTELMNRLQKLEEDNKKGFWQRLFGK